jgi:serine protease AprX
VGSYDHIKSGQGSVTENILKPDLVAPGTRILSCNAKWREQGAQLYVTKNGTSMSTPIVTGAIAQLLSKYPDMPNYEVKKRLMESCDKLNLSITKQGSGLLNVKKTLRM